MSLDVYLTAEKAHDVAAGSGIFVRENGSTKEITRAEWDEKHPGREPAVVRGGDGAFTSEVYARNITHNLGQMAEAAGLYECLWRPDEHGITAASQLIPLLRAGLGRLAADRARFEALNPKNGWGDYAGLVDFVSSYLAACEEYPTATVTVSR
jgi:hypothetical protein